MSCRLGLLVSHPIQYYVPWFRYLAKRLDIEVLYSHRQDGRGQSEAGFGVEFDWDIPLLEGYPYRWLTNVARRPSVSTFSGCDTPEVYEIVRRGQFDAILVSGWNRKSALQMIRACWQNKVPVLMRGDSQLMTKRSWVKSVVKFLPYCWFLPRIDAHLYVGKRNKAYLQHYGVPEKRLFFAPHFVDNDFFSTCAREAVVSGNHLRIRDEFNIPHDAFVVLFVGKFIPQKRPADFVRACLHILQLPEDVKMHAILVGDGLLSNDLQLLARPQAEQIHFAGFRNQTELPAFYCTSDVLILPGRETWGLVINEAMACGIPAIVSDVAGCVPDLIEEGRTGYTYPVGDVNALTQRLLALRQVWEDKPAVMHQAVAEKMSVYSIEKATEGLEKALEIVAKR